MKFQNMGLCVLLVVQLCVAVVFAVDGDILAVWKTTTPRCTNTTRAVCESNYCKIKAGQSCANYPNGCVLHASCTSASVCTCATPAWTLLNNGTCGPANNYAEGNCTGTSRGTCLDPNAECTATTTTTRVCKCKLDYTRIADNNTCKGEIGTVCKTIEPKCADTTRTVCENNICKLQVGKSCASNTSQCVMHATCESGINVCRCVTGWEPATNETTNIVTCRPAANYVNGMCDSSCVDPNAKCVGNTTKLCVCKPGYLHNVTNNSCIGPLSTYVGGNCTDSCKDVNAQCTANTTMVTSNTTRFCRCKLGFERNVENSTCRGPLPAYIGGQCLGVYGNYCRDANARCSNTTKLCMCKRGYQQNFTDNVCAGPIDTYYGGLCYGTGKGSCEDPNAECEGGFMKNCTCKSGYKRREDDNICQATSAVAVAAVSITLLFAALLTSRHL